MTLLGNGEECLVRCYSGLEEDAGYTILGRTRRQKNRLARPSPRAGVKDGRHPTSLGIRYSRNSAIYVIASSLLWLISQLTVSPASEVE